MNKKAVKRSAKKPVTMDNLWETKFKELIRFKKKYGHCYVPLRHPDPTGLGRWVNNQRRIAKEGQLKEDRRKRLEKIGFSFNAFEDKWQDMFSALVKFKKVHGHCNVPDDWPKNPKLARWVNTNRLEFKKGRLKKDRFEQLQNLGFVWRRHDAAWDEMYKKLLRFKEKFGHCGGSRIFEDGKLGMWIAAQRRLKKKGTLKKDRIKKLNQIGFKWTGSEKNGSK